MDHLGRYKIIEQTGTGAMGKVYRARDTSLDREIALKTIQTGVGVAPEIRQRFYREARACARLQHPNIITVFDMGEVETTAFIAMEFLKGADFRRIIQERRALSVETKLAACVDVCQALAHAHRHGVIHRDIKPSNLFLTDEGLTKVLDFGIARLPSSRLTVAGQILGTPNYMAPEQILGRPSDGRADLFSAAVVFFELLTYAHPFQGKSISGRIVHSEPDSLFDCNTSLPVMLEKVLARGLAKDPCLRYQSGDEFAADLRAILDALQGNASPSLSGVLLPSDHAIRPAQQQPEPASSDGAPEGQDLQEWRMSEALRLLPEFEAAIDGRDLASAHAAVCDLENRLAGDVRFAEAIRLCRSRLGQLDSETMSMPSPSPSAREAAANAATPGSVDLDATFFGSSAVTTIDLPSQASQPLITDPPVESAYPESTTRSEILNPPPSKMPRIAWPNLERRKLLIIAAGIVVCSILVLVAGVIALRAVPVEPSVATAVVRASTNIYLNPSRAATKIASVTNGTRLNVLSLPTSRDQEWIRVQTVTPKVLRPGYVRVAELGDWQGRTAAAGLALIRTLDPGEAGSEEQIRARIQELNTLATRFAEEPAAKEARLDIARSRLSLAQRYKTAGRVSEDWQGELKAARQDLEFAAAERDLQGQVVDLTRQIDELLADQPALIPAPPQTDMAPQPPTPDVSALLAQARQLRLDGDYPEAEKLIERILRISPRNKEARALRDKIRQAYEVEKK